MELLGQGRPLDPLDRLPGSTPSASVAGTAAAAPPADLPWLVANAGLEFLNTIGQLVLDPTMLMFLDESACNRPTSSRKRGWSPRGIRCVQKQRFVRGTRYSILPVLTLDGIITYKVVEGGSSGSTRSTALKLVCVQCITSVDN